MSLTDQATAFEKTIPLLFPAAVTRNADELSILFTRGPETPFKLMDADLASIQSLLDTKQVAEDTILYDPTSLELPIAFEGLGFHLSRRCPLFKDDKDNLLQYTLAAPSQEYLVFFLNSLADRSRTSAAARTLVRRRFMRPVPRRNPEDILTCFDYLLTHFSSFRTLKIHSGKPRSLEELLSCVSGFIFQVSYNTSIPLIEVRFLDQFLRSARMESIRRTALDELEPPRRVYIADLVYHYQMGLSSDSPPLQFLSFYHVAEHFFDAVYTDDMIASVVETLTGPSFSYRNRDNIKSLINTIKKKIRINKDRETFNEEESLRLAINKYVTFARLKDSLNALDPTLQEYYKTSNVGFADAPVCDLNEPDHGRLSRSIAQRVYKTRNAIVHSKDGGKGKYIPFHHDRELLPEVPLLRLIAEEIIMNSSKAM